MLNDKEIEKYNIIEKVVNGTMTRKEAMFELKKTRQQIYWLIKLYYSKGKEGFVHGNRGKNNPNKIKENIINELEDLYLEKYYDFNFEHFYEIINTKYNISYDAMLKHFTKEGIISPLAHKNTIKKYKEEMKEFINDNDNSNNNEKVELYNSRIIAAEKAILEDQIIFLYLGKKYKWMLAKSFGLVGLFLIFILLLIKQQRKFCLVGLNLKK